MAKMNYWKAQRVRREYDQTRTHAQIANSYGVSVKIIARILNNQSYTSPGSRTGNDASISDKWSFLCLRCGLPECCFVAKVDYDLCPILMAKNVLNITPAQAINGKAHIIGLLPEEVPTQAGF